MVKTDHKLNSGASAGLGRHCTCLCIALLTQGPDDIRAWVPPSLSSGGCNPKAELKVFNLFLSGLGLNL